MVEKRKKKGGEKKKKNSHTSFLLEALASDASTKVTFVEERVNKLRSSPVVAGSVQLKPHVDFLVARVLSCKSKLTVLMAPHAKQSSSPGAASTTAPLAPPPILQSEEEVVVDMLSPLGPRASQVSVEVPGPPKLPQKPESKSKSHIVERSSVRMSEEEEAKRKVSGSQIASVPAMRMGEVKKQEVSAMDVLAGGPVGGGATSPRKSPRDLRGIEMMGSTPLLKISSSSSAQRGPASQAPEATTPIRRPSRPEVDPGLGSPSPAIVSTPSQIPPPIPDRKSAVLDFDKIVGRVRGDSLVSDETPVDGDKTNWKAEYEKMAQKFEAAKGLIVKMQEKTRRMELQAAQVPGLLKKTSQLEGKVASLEMVKVHYEEKVPQLNTRIVELENELFVMKGSVGTSALDQVIMTGERVWVSYNHLWHEGEVMEKNADGSLLIKLDTVLDAKVFGPERVRKITVEGLESTPVVLGSAVQDLEDSSSSLHSEPPDTSASGANSIAPIAIEPRPLEPTSSSAGAAPTASTPGGRPVTTMDTLLASTKQNVKNLFQGTRRKADGPSSQPSAAGASNAATPVKAHDKLRSLFNKERNSVAVPKNEDGSSGLALGEEIPADAMALGDVQRIYMSDLWTALMDPGSSDALAEVFFSTFEYHSSWEQVLATLSTIYNESPGTEPEALERRCQVLKLVQKMVMYNPDLLKQKSTPSNFVKTISFADPLSLSGNNGEFDPESLQARGKMIVGDYGTSANNSMATASASQSSVSLLVPKPSRELSGARSPANPSRASGTVNSSRKVTVSGTPPGATSLSSSSIPQLGPRPSKAQVSPRMRPRNEASPRMSEGGEDHSFRGGGGGGGGDDDLSDEVTSDEMDGVSFEETEDNDLRTRKKGQALFKSIGAVYKSLNMDSQSLQNVFVTSALNSSGASGTTEGGDNTELDDSVSVSGETSAQPVRQLSFMEALMSWIEGSNVAADKANPEADKLMSAVASWRRGPSRRKSRSVVAKKLVHQKKGMLSNVRDFASVQITSFSPLQVAKQLFLEEWELFAAIKPSEFRKKRFMDAKSGHSFQYMVHRFNTWCNWIATEVLNRNTSLERASIIEFFIDVATECNKFHNFNSCYAGE
jgi:hypothetical protein